MLRKPSIFCTPLAGILFLGPGCGPSTILKNPESWPQQWCHRRLSTTPHAYLYASSDSAAGEIDRTCARVTREFVHDTEGRAGRGLIIVNDRADPIFQADWRAIYIASKRRAVELSGRADADAEKAWDEAMSEEKLADAGISRDLLLQMTPFALSSAEAREHLQLGPLVIDQVSWVAILPTRALLREAMRKTIDAGLKQEKVGLVRRMALAPMLAIFEPLMIDALSTMREVVIFEALASSEADWSEAHRDSVVRKFAKKKFGDVEKRINHAVPGAPSQPPTSRASEGRNEINRTTSSPASKE
ncbi:MAG TPA: hypothetical protein VNT79_10600 [Phycisphaerae bacterium]|nr:hypothetical protein [Phycisphaerae bacterium]